MTANPAPRVEKGGESPPPRPENGKSKVTLKRSDLHKQQNESNRVRERMGGGGGESPPFSTPRHTGINLDDTLDLARGGATWTDLETRLGFNAKSIDRALRRHGHHALARQVTARSQLNPETTRGTTGLVLTRAKEATTASVRLCGTCPGPSGHHATCDAVRAAWADLKGTL